MNTMNLTEEEVEIIRKHRSKRFTIPESWCWVARADGTVCEFKDFDIADEYQLFPTEDSAIEYAKQRKIHAFLYTHTLLDDGGIKICTIGIDTRGKATYAKLLGGFDLKPITGFLFSEEKALWVTNYINEREFNV
jgi:hypothetical protein